MADARECPMCGEMMHLRVSEQITRIPGTTQTTTRVVYEWVCRECDYFEEAEDRERG